MMAPMPAMAVEQTYDGFGAPELVVRLPASPPDLLGTLELI